MTRGNDGTLFAGRSTSKQADGTPSEQRRIIRDAVSIKISGYETRRGLVARSQKLFAAYGIQIRQRDDAGIRMDVLPHRRLEFGVFHSGLQDSGRCLRGDIGGGRDRSR